MINLGDEHSLHILPHLTRTYLLIPCSSISMFTGIIEGFGKVIAISRSRRSLRHPAKMRILLKVPSKLMEGLRSGDSVSLNGTCLTIMKLKNNLIEFEVVQETISRTCIGLMKKGDLVNIELSLKVGDRLDGHFVLGHTDGIGIIKEVKKSAGETKMWIASKNHALIPYMAQKGSIAVDGISLTLVDLDTVRKRFSVSLIPYTLQNTTLGFKREGDLVNIEIDVLSRYVINYQMIGNN